MKNHPETGSKKLSGRKQAPGRKQSIDRKKPETRSEHAKQAGPDQRKASSHSKPRPDKPQTSRSGTDRSQANKTRTDKNAEKITEEPKAQAARLHKVMAAAGLGSRRALEQEIRSGGIQLNGATATLGQSLKAGDRLQWGEREWRVTENQAQHRTLIYNKPEGEIISRSDPEGRPTVFDKLPFLKDARWVAIGRLDINTTGLLLLTTDGELAHVMMHPSTNVDREYVCRVRGLVSDEQLEQLRTGVELDDGPAHFSDVQRMGGQDGQQVNQASANQWFQVTLLEGRNREVRRLWESMDHMVSRLKRVRYGAALLPKGLKAGHWHEINANDHQVLREDVGLTAPTPELTLQAVRQAGTGKPSVPSRHSARHAAHKQFIANNPEAAEDGSRAGRGGGKGRGRAGSRTSNKLTLRSSESPWKKSAGERKASKPGSPAGQGRRPHPKSRRSER
jgi:23S rRNA pseudouridine2605 synthase